MHDNQVIGMPSHAVDEAWHGLILCTARYAAFRNRPTASSCTTTPTAAHPTMSRAPTTLSMNNFVEQ